MKNIKLQINCLKARFDEDKNQLNNKHITSYEQQRIIPVSFHALHCPFLCPFFLMLGDLSVLGLLGARL